MNQVYEYRQTPSKGAIWLAIIGVMLLLAAVVINSAEHLMWLVWVSGGVTLAWMIVPKPISGIRIDDDYLVLSAWRNPKPLPLDSIAYLRAVDGNDENPVTIFFKDGSQEGIFAGDLPDIDTLISVMAERGIPVRDVY
jgi:hypothetical protein